MQVDYLHVWHVIISKSLLPALEASIASIRSNARVKVKKEGGIFLLTRVPTAGAMSCCATSGCEDAAPSSDDDASWPLEVRSAGGSDSASSLV